VRAAFENTVIATADDPRRRAGRRRLVLRGTRCRCRRRSTSRQGLSAEFVAFDRAVVTVEEDER